MLLYQSRVEVPPNQFVTDLVLHAHALKQPVGHRFVPASVAVRRTMKIKCLNCQHSFEPDPKRTVGCLCDSDAPTWIGVASDGKLITMSYANYQINED